MTPDRRFVDWYVYALTGDPGAVIDWRCIHDQKKDLPAHNYRGTVEQCWATLCDYNARGYGIFASINAMKPVGNSDDRRNLENVEYIRSHVIDLDNTVTVEMNYNRAVENGASFAVQSSPGKYHVYWRVQPYTGNDFYTLQQRKLAQYYDGDRKIIDATRVMRVPGFFHQKGEPKFVNSWALPKFDRVRTADEMASDLASINVVEHISGRSPLGSKEMAAPSLQWLYFSLTLLDPNEMDRADWLSYSAAFKQAGWTLAAPEELFKRWSDWCSLYKKNDPGENIKLWDSIRDTEVGWTSIRRRCPVIEAHITFGHKDAPQAPAVAPGAVGASTPAPVNAPLTIPNNGAGVPDFGEILSETDCKIYFKDCYFIEQSGKIYSNGRFMNATQFNGAYGGKNFIISTTGKITDEAWKAATRSTCWTIPKVDHVRFLPDVKPFTILKDDLNRDGLNVYVPAVVESQPGDITPFLDWLNRILPDKGDQKSFLDYLAHCIKYPGHKIFWAPLLQSTEGIGKTIFKEIMQRALGTSYVYSPKAPELVKSGSTFNAWQRNRLMILVDEIKIDERRELIEILKPMITDARIEIQSKGVDQDMEDNVANWLFFSNYKDAVPINKNGRRFPIYYSALQSVEDILAAGMDEDYFKNLWSWLRDQNGFKYITHWFLNYPIEKGSLPNRAPNTSSTAEALKISRSPMENIIADCITDGVTGFRGGYVSTLAVIKHAKAGGIRTPSHRSVQVCLENMGYVSIGRAVRPYMQEDINHKSEIYATMSTTPIEGYGRAQGYE